MGALAGAAVTLLVLPVVVMGAAISVLDTGTATSGGPSGPMPAREAIPLDYLALYDEAGTTYAVSPDLLAAVGKVECDHGRHPDCLIPNAFGAVGPMQFLPATFTRYQHASGNPEPSIYDPRDSIYAAAAKLNADNVGLDPWAALYSYNHSDEYVATVVGWALAYGWQPPDDTLLTRAALTHPHLTFASPSRSDIDAGLVDARVLALLLVLGSEHQLGGIGPLVSGHYECVGGGSRATRPGCSISNHVVGRAADVGTVDHHRVSATHPGARAVVETALALPEPLRPDELGSPFADLDPLPGAFTDTDHQTHLHLGYDR